MGEEADYMWQTQLCDWGAEYGDDLPDYEVITGKRQKRVFAGSRAACWAFRRANGGFVRKIDAHDR